MITLDTIDYSLHSIEVKSAAGNGLAIDASGKITAIVEDGGGSITVDAVDLDIRDLDFATDSVDVSGSSVSISGTVTVSATDFDIRDLTHVSDSVKIGDGTDFLAINADGSINAAFTEAGYSTWQVTAVSVTTTESTVSALANRLRVEIQNLGSNDIYIRQSTGVSSSNGLKIPKGSSFEQTLDAGAAIYMVAASGSSDVRIAQYAA